MKLPSNASILTTLSVVILLALNEPSLASGNIRLQVIDNESRRPIENVQVQLSPRNGEETEHSLNSDGQVFLENLDAGLYEITVQHKQYFPYRIPSVRVVEGKTTPVKAELMEAKGNVEEILVLGVLSGQNFLNGVSSRERDREALRSAAGGGSDVLRSLDGLPGLFSDGGFSTYTVRGNSPRNNLILVDGIPFENVVHFRNAFGQQEDLEGGGRYSVFAPNIIASAKFQPGGWEPAYGGQAGSLLQLEVAEGNQDTPSATVRFDVAGLEIGYDGPSYFQDNTSVLFSARYLDFTQLFETIGIEDLGEPSLSDVIVKTSSEFSNDKLNLLLLHSSEDYKRRVKHAIASDEEEIGEYVDVSLADISRQIGLYALTWQHLLGNDAELVQRFYYRFFDEDATQGESYPDLSPLGTPPEDVLARPEILFSKQEEKETGYRLDFNTPNALGRFSTGLRVQQIDLNFALDLQEEWIIYEYSFRDQGPSPQQRFLVLTEENTNNAYKQAETNFSLYIDQDLSAGNWEFRAGFRYDRDNFSDEDIYSPRAAANWQTTSKLRITTTLGRYHQAPAYSQRATSSSNVFLENEIVDQLSIGFAYALAENLDFSIEPYLQRMSNLIAQSNNSLRQRGNTGEGEAYGFDTAITRRFAEGWSADFTYSYNNSQVKDAPGEDFYDANFGRPHSLSFGGIWEINERWKISTRWKYASGLPSDAYVIHPNVLGDSQALRFSRETVAYNTSRHDAFSSLNLRVDYRRTFANTQFIAFFDVINLLGTPNPGDPQFDERSGKNIESEGNAVPLFGLRLQW